MIGCRPRCGACSSRPASTCRAATCSTASSRAPSRSCLPCTRPFACWTDYRAAGAAAARSTRAGTAFGATEAPRGLLWHRYEIECGRSVSRARIVPPTSQNQARIEADLRASLEAYGLARATRSCALRAETVIRNYDPCISCATHFLDLRLEAPVVIRVLGSGCGSPFGDDRAGWAAAAPLAASNLVTGGADRIDVRVLDRPGSLLLAEFGQSSDVILIDALCSGALPGTIQRLDAEDVCGARSVLSSHGVGVAQAVDLARSLGCLPARFAIFGIEVDRRHAGNGLSPAVMEALPQLVEQVVQQAEAWRVTVPTAT